MEEQLESTVTKIQDTSSSLLALNEKLRHKQQQLEHLRRKNEILTNDLNQMKESQDEQIMNFNLLETSLQQIRLQMLQRDTKILDMIHENGTLKGKLEIQSKQFRVTLEQSDEIVELKQKLVDLHYEDMISTSLRYCKHNCHSTQRELEVMRQDYNQMRVANEELNEKLTACTDDNSLLKRKMKVLQADSVETNELHRNAIQSEIKKAIESCIQQMMTHSTNLTANKRQVEGQSDTQSKRPRLNNRKDTMTKELADHPTERINYAKKPTSNEEKHRQLPFAVNSRCRRVANSHDSMKKLPYDQASTAKRGNRKPCGAFITTVPQIHPEPRNIIPTQATDESHIDNVIVAYTKGEKTIIRERIEEIEEIESNRDKDLDKTNNESDDEIDNESTCIPVTVTSSPRTPDNSSGSDYGPVDYGANSNFDTESEFRWRIKKIGNSVGFEIQSNKFLYRFLGHYGHYSPLSLRLRKK